MAPDKDAKNDETADGSKKSALKRFKPIIIVAALMIGEGVGIFALMKVLSGPPESTIAAEDADALGDPLNLDDKVEVDICEVDAFNRKEGRLYVYNISLSALIPAESVEKMQNFVDVRNASIKDRVQFVIRAADPKHLNDPSLETIKRQLKFELNNLLGGEELIEEVLIGKLLQSRVNL